ncbi:MAG: RDD family protein [Dehalococcoidia bacterium]
MAESQEGVEVEYAGFWMRLGAYLIDGIILTAINFAIYFVPGFVYFTVTWELGSLKLVSSAFAVVILVLCIIISIAYPICFWRWRGQTPGKMAVGIKLIRSNNSPVSWRAAAMRFLGYIICWVTFGLLFLWIAFDSRKRGIHDRIAGTCVIKLPRKKVLLNEAYEGS